MRNEWVGSIYDDDEWRTVSLVLLQCFWNVALCNFQIPATFLPLPLPLLSFSLTPYDSQLFPHSTHLQLVHATLLLQSVMSKLHWFCFDSIWLNSLSLSSNTSFLTLQHSFALFCHNSVYYSTCHSQPVCLLGQPFFRWTADSQYVEVSYLV